MSVICPICDTPTSLESVVIRDEMAYLPDKSTKTNAVYGKAIVSAITDDDSPHYESYGVFTCQACYKRFIAKKNKITDNEWVPVYPIPHKPVGEEVPEPIKGEFEEASLCFAVGAYKACASMCQRALESLCQNKKISGLNELLSGGIISQALFNRATEIRLWAGITKHKPLDEPVLEEDAELLLRFLEDILDHGYVEQKAFDSLVQKRKQLGKKE
jgi:hypothetical protein